MEALNFISNLQAKSSALYQKSRKHWQDILIVLVLAIAAAIASYQVARLIGSAIVDEKTFDVWFSADCPRVFGDMAVRGENHYRTKVHPLFVLITFPPVYILRKAFSLEAITAVRIVISIVSSLWIATLFILLRLINCRRFDAILFSLLGAVSASAVFWFVVPETYSFGSLTILIALVIAAISQYRQLSPWWYITTSAVTLSITTTNWMAGILVTAVNQRWKKSLQITVNAFSLVVILWAVQKYIFPTAEFFLGDREEKRYVNMAGSGGPLTVIKSFLFHTMVMPNIKIESNTEGWPLMFTQPSIPGSGSIWGSVAVGLWAALLGLGLWGLFSIRNQLKFRLVLGLLLLGQLALHSVYGNETFLFSLHFLPLLILLAALSTLTPARLLGLLLAGILLVSVTANNTGQLSKAIKFFQTHGSGRHIVQVQMQERPTDPWSRGTGHVVLAAPGSREEEKAYHEPGGSFSPSVGSFGVSLWVSDRDGKLKTTSDTIPLDQIQQELSWSDRKNIPGILTKTSYYQALWSKSGVASWTLDLKTDTKSDRKPIPVIRSVGPAGGPIQSLDWNGKRLLINDRWSITSNPAPKAVYLGEEGSKDWMTQRSPITKIQSENGWGYARFELGDGNNWQISIQDSTSSPPKITPITTSTRATLDLNLPDPQFASSLNAQVAHLLMSIVGGETRPGEPTNYPLAWQRDGAYVLVALARAGQLEVAKQLSTYFAENDFFGGFGPEADAPGLSIWALTEVATQLNQPEYDQWLWPHIRRKAEFILTMLATKQPIRQPAPEPVVPSIKNEPDLTLVAEAARNGLIVGRMDWDRPLLFVNAVSYRGLLDAATIAQRVNQPADAQRWRNQAVQLQQAWEKAFKPPESENDHTYISSLWPTWVAANQTDVLRQNLQTRWKNVRDEQGDFRKTPLWTYFDIAEAHQWLFLQESSRVWKTLRWFWQHQASPGLYTWWEGTGEENSFGRWEQVRGWVNPPHVTPHYWTAAEILLLQLDMLAYMDGAANEPTVVIGAGIPPAWLNQPMSVRGLPMPNALVDWNWDGQQMEVKIQGQRINVKLAEVFPPGTSLLVEYSGI